MKKNHKVILLGESSVGKTSIIQTLLHGIFQEKTTATLGACFQRYEYDQSLTMDIWDTAGQERFRSLLKMYYQGSDAVLLVFDLTNENSLKTVEYWARQIQANCDSLPCIVLVGNKIDIKAANEGVSKVQINRCLDKHKKWKYIQCSAKTNQNVQNIFKTVGLMLKEQALKKQKSSKNSKMKIHPSRLHNNSNRESCC